MLKSKSSQPFEIKLANGKEDSCGTGYEMWAFYERMSSPQVPQNYEYININLAKREESENNSLASKSKKTRENKEAK